MRPKVIKWDEGDCFSLLVHLCIDLVECHLGVCKKCGCKCGSKAPSTISAATVVTGRIVVPVATTCPLNSPGTVVDLVSYGMSIEVVLGDLPHTASTGADKD